MKFAIRRLIFCLAVTFPFIGANAQPSIDDALNHFGFVEGRIFENGDTITYYLRNYQEKPTNLVVFIQGTDANPLFSYKMKDGEPVFYRWFGDEYKQLDSTYTYAVIPKPGMAGLFNDDNLSVPEKYQQNNYLDYRVNQVSQSINAIIANHLRSPNKIIVYGHSEGAVIAAALANHNQSITHLGFWSGNVLNNFYEFALFNRIESLQGAISDSVAHDNIMSILGWYQSVIDNPESTEKDHFGFTSKRWSSYEKAPIEYLVTLDIPIYALFATEDESTPIETAYLLPIRFMEHRKNNLTFEVCIGCDHAYREQNGDKTIKHWNDNFLTFIDWTNQD